MQVLVLQMGTQSPFQSFKKFFLKVENQLTVAYKLGS